MCVSFDQTPTGNKKAFERFVKWPYPEGVRLDSIVERPKEIAYYYTQQVATKGEGKTLRITLHGQVEGLDGSSYLLPVSDTLQYNISSMLSFIDRTPRYVTRVIEKYAVVKARNYLCFRLGDACIIDTLGDNGEQLAHIETLMERLISQAEFYVDSIILSASASPEGRMQTNERLARERAFALKKYLTERFGKETDTLITVRWIAEDWPELSARIRTDRKITNRDAILKLIAAERNPDRREQTIRQRFPKDYAYRWNASRSAFITPPAATTSRPSTSISRTIWDRWCKRASRSRTTAIRAAKSNSLKRTSLPGQSRAFLI